MKVNQSKPFILAICGGSGSGKSTLAFGLEDSHPGQVMIFHLDDYFKPEAEVPFLHGMVNWDDPDALYVEKMAADLRDLKSGKPTTINTKSPRFNPDFLKTGKRIPVVFEPKPLIVVEGFMALHFKELRELYDLALFLEVPFEVHTSRRVHGKLHNFPEDYDELVLKPMHEQYVLPSQAFAQETINVEKLSQTEVLEQVTTLLAPKLQWGGV